MKNLIMLNLVFLSIGLSAQDKTILYEDFKINELTFIAKKNDIIKFFGNPKKVSEPKYECGFLSEDEQGKKFYSLVYNNSAFTGNPTESYQLEKFNFASQPNCKITDKGREISSKTTKKNFEAIFGIKVFRDEISVSQLKSDDKLIWI